MFHKIWGVGVLVFPRKTSLWKLSVRTKSYRYLKLGCFSKKMIAEIELTNIPQWHLKTENKRHRKATSLTPDRILTNTCPYTQPRHTRKFFCHTRISKHRHANAHRKSWKYSHLGKNYWFNTMYFPYFTECYSKYQPS